MEGREQDQAVLEGYPEDRDESDRGGNTQVEPRQFERDDPADQRQRDVNQNNHHLPHRIEDGEEQERHQRQDERGHERQGAVGALLQFELPAPGEDVLRRDVDPLLDLTTGVSHETADIASSHVALDRDESLVLLAIDEAGSLEFLDPGEHTERYAPSAGKSDKQILDLFGVIAEFREEPQEDIEPALFLIHLADGDAADRRLDRLLDITDVEPVPGGDIPVDDDLDVILSGELSHLNVLRTLGFKQDLFDLFGGGAEQGEVFTVEFQGELRPRAGDQFIEVVGDRLGHSEAQPRQYIQPVFDIFDQLLDVPERLPFPLRSQLDQYLGVVHEMGVTARLAATDPAQNPGHLGNVAQDQFHFRGGLDRFFETDVRVHDGSEVERPFLQPRHVFTPHRGDERDADQKNRPGDPEHAATAVHAGLEEGDEDAPDPSDQQWFPLLLTTFAKQVKGKRGDDDEGEQE